MRRLPLPRQVPAERLLRPEAELRPTQSFARSAASRFRAPANSVRNVASRKDRAASAMTGVEWVVDAWGCSPEALRNADALNALFETIIRDLKLRPVGEMKWHTFPGSGGIT